MDPQIDRIMAQDPLTWSQRPSFYFLLGVQVGARALSSTGFKVQAMGLWAS